MAADRVVAGKPATEETVRFSGRVIELDGGKPVEGATLVVVRSLSGLNVKNAPSWVGKSTITTDAQGCFQLTFPPEQAADHRLSVEIARVAHPDFIARKGVYRGMNAPRLALLRQQVKLGDKPFFDTITLERGMEYSGTVVTPLGAAAADVSFECYAWGKMTNLAQSFRDDYTGQTDANGQFRLRMPRAHGVMMTLTPEKHPARRQFWGTEQPNLEPEVFAPADLGTVFLKPGRTLAGRVVDRRGHPIPNQVVGAYGPFGTHPVAATNAQGEFEFAHLRPGNYALFGEKPWFLTQQAAQEDMPQTTRVICPTRVYVPEVGAPAPVVLHEADTVAVEVQCEDSHHEPVLDLVLTIHGTVPAARNQAMPAAVQKPPAPGKRPRFAATVDRVEPESVHQSIGWGAVRAPDPHGRVVFRVPKGLLDARVAPANGDESYAFQSRIGQEKSPDNGGNVSLGVLAADRNAIFITRYRSPVVLITVTTDDSTAHFSVPNCEAFSWTDNGGMQNQAFALQADGRYRSQSLMPGREHTLAAWDNGWVPNTTRRLVLPEGSIAETALTIRRSPASLRAGDLAPPVLVRTIEGKVISLYDLRGKWVLLHFCRDAREELPVLKAINDRFGKSPRFAMLSLSLFQDRAALATISKEKNIAWPQVFLRDSSCDPIAIEYGVDESAKVILIGPDGTLAAIDPTIAVLTRSLTEALHVE
jgi:hypothetical protein